MAHIAIIVPTLNEESQIVAGLKIMQVWRGSECELIIADGGSVDQTVALAEPLADRVVAAPKGRAAQMNAGAASARSEILWFLHADSLPPDNAIALIQTALADPNRDWGRFDVRLSGPHPALRMVETRMNGRSRLTGIATGDQAIFVTREAFKRLGGFPAIPLMEDIVFSSSMREADRPACIAEKVKTSGRRWEKHGLLRTILTMWWLRLRFFLGASPDDLAREYACTPRET